MARMHVSQAARNDTRSSSANNGTSALTPAITHLTDVSSREHQTSNIYEHEYSKSTPVLTNIQLNSKHELPYH